jgi:hypothetical protein
MSLFHSVDFWTTKLGYSVITPYSLSTFVLLIKNSPTTLIIQRGGTYGGA